MRQSSRKDRGSCGSFSLTFIKVLFFCDALLILYWMSVLIYIAAKHEVHLQTCVLFVLHFVSFMALVSYVDLKEEENPGSSIMLEEPGGGNERGKKEEEIYSRNRYPLFWGTAAFITTISDAFSLVGVELEYRHGNMDRTAYLLLLVLHVIGLALATITFLFVVFNYIVGRKSCKNTTYL